MGSTAERGYPRGMRGVGRGGFARLAAIAVVVIVIVICGIARRGRADAAPSCDPGALAWSSPELCLPMPDGWRAVPAPKRGKAAQVVFARGGEARPGEAVITVTWVSR